MEAALQQTAATIWADLNLSHLFDPSWTIYSTGARALGVMVNRDIDVTIDVGDINTAREHVEQIRRRLRAHPNVSDINFRDDTGALNMEPDRYPDGLYLLVTYEAAVTWTLDLWFVDRPDRQPDVRHVAELLPRIDDDLRRIILTIKAQLRARPELKKSLPSFTVYQAVLDHHVANLQQLLSYARQPE